MKKIFLLLTTVLFMTGCDPMKGIYDELEKQEQGVVKTTEYTLTAADYTTLAKQYVEKQLTGVGEAEKADAKKKAEKDASSLGSLQAFNSKVSAAAFIPNLLKKLFPEWGKESSVVVTYNEVLPLSPEVSAFRGATFVDLKEKDLKGANILSISPLSKEDEAKLLSLAQSKGKKDAKTLLVQASLGTASHAYLFLDGNIASQKIYLTPSKEDFASMGSKYMNFSSSMPASEYLPTLLDQKLPYAKEGESRVVVYAYYDPSKKATSVRTDLLVRSEGSWKIAPKVQSLSTQFVQVGEKWVFDPTIRFAMGAEDYAILHAWVKANKPEYISTKYPDNEEWWFGGSGYYKNFTIDMTPMAEDAGKSGDDLAALRKERIVEGLQLVLATKYPQAPASVDGIEQHYIITLELRQNSANTVYTYDFKGLGNDKFELISSTPAAK